VTIKLNSKTNQKFLNKRKEFADTKEQKISKSEKKRKILRTIVMNIQNFNKMKMETFIIIHI